MTIHPITLHISDAALEREFTLRTFIETGLLLTTYYLLLTTYFLLLPTYAALESEFTLRTFIEAGSSCCPAPCPYYLLRITYYY